MTTMKKIVLIVFILSLSYSLFAREKQNPIPGWVENRLNKGQLEQLRKLSEKVEEIDYAIFKRRDLDTTELYDKIRKATENVSGESVSFMKADRKIIPYKSETLTYIRKSYIVYSSIEGYDAHVVLTVTYGNTTGEVPYIEDWHVRAKSFSGIPVKFVESDAMAPYNSRLDYNSTTGEFDGYIVGALQYVDPYGKAYEDEVAENFQIPIF